MCTADGSYILDTILMGKQNIKQSASRKDKIVQERLDNTAWSVWRKFLRPLYYAGSSKLTDTHSLGDWNSAM